MDEKIVTRYEEKLLNSIDEGMREMEVIIVRSMLFNHKTNEIIDFCDGLFSTETVEGILETGIPLGLSSVEDKDVVESVLTVKGREIGRMIFAKEFVQELIEKGKTVYEIADFANISLLDAIKIAESIGIFPMNEPTS